MAKERVFDRHERVDLPEESAFWRSELPVKPPFTAIYRFARGGGVSGEAAEAPSTISQASEE